MTVTKVAKLAICQLSKKLAKKVLKPKVYANIVQKVKKSVQKFVLRANMNAVNVMKLEVWKNVEM